PDRWRIPGVRGSDQESEQPGNSEPYLSSFAAETDIQPGNHFSFVLVFEPESETCGALQIRRNDFTRAVEDISAIDKRRHFNADADLPSIFSGQRERIFIVAAVAAKAAQLRIAPQRRL